MTADRAAGQPTPAELEILGVLWEHGPSTVRQVHDRLGERRGVGYTTVLKLMQIMTDKGLLDRDASQRQHLYRAKGKGRMRRRIVHDLIDKAFAGSASELVLSALDDRPTDPDELARIRALLDQLEGKETP